MGQTRESETRNDGSAAGYFQACSRFRDRFTSSSAIFRDIDEQQAVCRREVLSYKAFGEHWIRRIVPDNSEKYG